MRFFLLIVLGFSKIFSEVVGVDTLYFCDKDRNRPIVVELWYPIAYESNTKKQIDSGWVHPVEIRNVAIENENAQYPLILFSHGQGGDVRDRVWMVEKLVEAGYIVASVEHYGDTWDFSVPDIYLQAWNRPLDVSFALDQLLTNSRFSRNIHPEKIGFAGFSLGGMTGLWLSGAICTEFEKLLKRYQFFTRYYPQEVVDGLDYEKTRQSYHDPRIKVYVYLAPSSWGYKPNTLKTIYQPSLIIGASEDDILPPSSHASYLAEHMKNAQYDLILGKVGHYVFLNRVTTLGEEMFEERYFRDHPSVNREEVHESVGNKVVDFFQRYF